ncbi:hypothetical protein K458DRAFT_444602 [Lentithecium fluviatile CBS 122367]|uniref:Uncharacterized protein n=1 Tax=Lentithecium fluviatile CBS 122367 TaxID=1168545 RepID=A0A6G1IUX3_9PLEO|nr:hypothetical protein K458DRAFT_444602 [Lentithecium fluviatile CBS 122367]
MPTALGYGQWRAGCRAREIGWAMTARWLYGMWKQNGRRGQLPRRAASSARDLNPTVEDHYSDDEAPPPEALRRSPAANVAAKRSHHSDLGDEKPAVEKVVSIDQQSDSGYSSHTAATMSSSADSAISAKASSPPTAPSSAASFPPSSPATTKRRPTLGPDDRKDSSQSPRKPLQRTGSVASKRPPASSRRPRSEDCTDPNCTKCGPNAIPQHQQRGRGSRSEASGADSARDGSYPPSFDQRSQRSDPAPSHRSPPSPIYTRQPAPYAHGSTMVQPAQTRRRSSSTTRRPVSYHEGAQPSYWPGMPAPYPSPPQEHHGPPPALSAYSNMHHPQQMSPFPMGPIQPGYYMPGQPIPQTSPPYEHQRPPLSARGSSNSNSYQTRRPQPGFGPTTLVTHGGGSDQHMPSARFHDPPRSARQERFPPAQESEDESSEYSSSEVEDEPPARNECALMPPPKLKRSKDKARRPELRHAKTTQVYNERRQSNLGMSQSSTLPERTRERDPRGPRVSTVPPSRAPSKSRPALVQHPKAQSAFETPRPAKVVVENSQSRRRQSYLAYNQEYVAEQKRRNRDSKIYRDDYDDHEDAILVSEPPRRRADTATSVSRRDEYGAKERWAAMDAEAYQQRARGTNEPLADAVHKAAKRASRVPSGPSEAGSNRSDDRKTRVSQSARTAVTNSGGNGDIRLRVDASAPLSLQFNGDMEGRTLQINPAEDGMAEIVIGSSRGEESVYRSERGSTVGSRRSLVPARHTDGATRRDLEEASVRSGRSSQGRREREQEQPRRPLRRRQTEYN